MKRCPTCNKTFTDQKLSFCIDDGTPLALVEGSADEITRVAPSPGLGPESAAGSQAAPTMPAHEPPRAYVPPGGGQPRRRVWPWIVGILAVILLLLAGMGILAAILIPNMIRSSNRNASNSNTNVYRSENTNIRPSNSNVNVGNENAANSNVAEFDSAPTSETEVLSQLSDLEHEWTVANINADKTKLDRILADDYVGTSADGKTQGKAEYLRTIERDTTIQNWEFEDLKVDLNGDRAALTGIIRLQIQDQPVAYRFTDKFVWRDRRWQATGSDVTPVK